MTKLSSDPQKINKETWYFEERRGLCVVRSIYRSDGALVQNDMFYLPWKRIASSVDRWRRSKVQP